MSALSAIDWIVLAGTLLSIAAYGIWRTRGSRNIQGYLMGDNTMKWGTIGLSVMATQASAITFLSTPGEGYESGMAFVQNYFGIPLALIIVCAVFIPIYYKLKVFTAYEFLETRFDLRTRVLAAILFFLQRGLQAGITIYAPAIILSTILGWDLNTTILMVGVLVIIYTVSGGTKAVSITQTYQMAVIMGGMFIAFYMILDSFPEYISFGEAVSVAGKMGKLEAVDFSFDVEKRYTFWSGITGGLFLALSYFGTDQSQVQRYLGGKSVAESRMGLIFNALLKIPMQFFILFTGVMVFIFYQFEKPPVYFKQNDTRMITQTEYAGEFKALDDEYAEVFGQKQEAIRQLVTDMETGNEEVITRSVDEVNALESRSHEIRSDVVDLLKKNDPDTETGDADYVFLTFILTYLPKGIIGLLLAVIFSAAMSSTASELNALGSTSTIDIYKRLIRPHGSDGHYVVVSRLLTAFWGLLAITFAIFAYLVENLIEALNIVASLLYGTPLGIFLVAFFFKKVQGRAVFIAAILAQLTVLFFAYLNNTGRISIGYLWYNVIGCLSVILIGLLIQAIMGTKKPGPKVEPGND